MFPVTRHRAQWSGSSLWQPGESGHDEPCRIEPVAARCTTASSSGRSTARSAEQRGIEAARKMLDSIVAPDIDPGMDEGLREFIAKREEVLPDGVV